MLFVDSLVTKIGTKSHAICKNLLGWSITMYFSLSTIRIGIGTKYQQQCSNDFCRHIIRFQVPIIINLALDFDWDSNKIATWKRIIFQFSHFISLKELIRVTFQWVFINTLGLLCRLIWFRGNGHCSVTRGDLLLQSSRAGSIPAQNKDWYIWTWLFLLSWAFSMFSIV